MANNLRKPVEISPGARDTNNANTVANAAFTEDPASGWVSQWFDVEGTPHGSEEVSLMVNVDWNGATDIGLLVQAEHQRPAELARDDGVGLTPDTAIPQDVYTMGRLNSSFEVEQDEITLLQANFLTDPGSMEMALQVKGISRLRVLARRPTAGGPPTLRIQVLSGGGWRGA